MLHRLTLLFAVALVAFGVPALLPNHVALLDESEAATTTFNVRDYGARGDGTHDDSQAVRRAIAKAATRPGSTVYFPAGVYRCATPTRLANRVNLRGSGMEASWLKGRLEFGSGSRISRLKIGDTGTCAVANRANASRTTFSRCRLHGGGSQPNSDGAVLYLGGGQGNVSDVVFVDCRIERTTYRPPAGVDAWRRGVGNTISINEFSHLVGRGHVEGITFRDCHLGASNGRAKGALRMMMEAFCWDGPQNRVYHGWKDLTFDGCTIEASDTTGLDFADGTLSSNPNRHAADGVVITGCTFLGARLDETWGHGGLPIVYECPTGIVIKKNKFYCSPQEAIGGSWVRDSTSAPAMLIQGNVFDMTRSPSGLKHQRGEPCLSIVGHNSRVVGNTFRYNTGTAVLIKSGGGSRATAGNIVRGNTFIDTRTNGGEPTVQFVDDHGRGCYRNRIVGNTIRNRAAGRRGVIVSTTSGTNYATDNTIVCGDSLPFVEREGQIVRSGNKVN